jgi:hypothetical protein
MAQCDACGTSILFGGIKQGDLRFCGPKCAENGALVQLTQMIPEDELDRYVREVHQGACPKCGGPGPVDVHTSHRVYSALVFTSWSSRLAICCPPCGRKQQLADAAFSFFLGWWGFPFGLIITPVQVGRNLAALIGLGAPDPEAPSPALRRQIGLWLAGQRRG